MTSSYSLFNDLFECGFWGSSSGPLTCTPSPLPTELLTVGLPSPCWGLMTFIGHFWVHGEYVKILHSLLWNKIFTHFFLLFRLLSSQAVFAVHRRTPSFPKEKNKLSTFFLSERNWVQFQLFRLAKLLLQIPTSCQKMYRIASLGGNREDSTFQVTLDTSLDTMGNHEAVIGIRDKLFSIQVAEEHLLKKE